MSLQLQGNLRIGARFNKPLPEPVTCILYAEFPGHVEIDNARNVTLEGIPLRSIKFIQTCIVLSRRSSNRSFTIHTYIKLNNCCQPRQTLMPGSQWVAVCISESGMLNILIRMVCRPTISKS